MNRQISDRIKILGFFMTCVIVCYHCPKLDSTFASSVLDGQLNMLLRSVSEHMGTLAMSHFFTVTGYLLFRNYAWKDYPAKMRRRISSLLVPYLLWQCIAAAVEALRGRYVFTIPDFLYRTFCLVKFPLDGPLWYVFAVFLLALISPLLLPFFRSKKLGWGIVMVSMVILRLSARFEQPAIRAVLDHGYIPNIMAYFSCYLVGCFYGKFETELSREDGLKYVLSAWVLGFLLEGMLPGFFQDLAGKLLPMMTLYLLPVPQKLKEKQIYGLSFLMYALHMLIIDPVCSHPLLPKIYQILYAYTPLAITLFNLLCLGLVLAVDIGLAALIHKVLSRCSPRLLGALTGGRAG